MKSGVTPDFIPTTLCRQTSQTNLVDYKVTVVSNAGCILVS